MKLGRELLQTKLLLKKNILVAKRAWISTLIELSSPALFILVLLIIAKAPSPLASLNRPTTSYDSNLPLCQSYIEDRCFTLMYSPSNSTLINELISLMANTNSPTLNITTDMNSTGGVVAMESAQDIFDFVAQNPNVTMAGISFEEMPANFTDYPDPIVSGFNNFIVYNILWNATCPNFIDKAACIDYVVSVNAAIQRTINIYQSKRFNLTATPSTMITTSTYPLYDPSANSVGTYGCLFFYCGSMVSFIFLVYKIAFEKEKHLKQGMVMMGLSGSVYFVSWFITCLVINTIITLVTIGVGAACQFSFFLNTNFMVNFLCFFVYTLCMNQVAFFVLSFIQSTKAAIGIGMTIFIIGSILQLNFSLMGPFLFQILYEQNNTASTVARAFLYVLPMSHFSKMITDINQITLLSKYTGVDFTWSDLYINLNSPAAPNVDIPSTYESLINMIILSIVYTILAWYFEHVIPGNDGTAQKPWFFLLPSYWGITKKTPKYIDIPIEVNDNDVLNTIQKVNDPSNSSPVIIKGLSKTYHNLFNSKKDVKALKYLSLSIDKGILCLLGKNGCGKSTTIGMLTGLIEPSSGDATIFGHSVVGNIDQVRKRTSVCPQHDILWNELTAYEHLQLFTELKGVEKGVRQFKIDEALESVRLTKVGHNQISTFSGGMKRRLSVAISVIGDPSIIYFDEPTTGLDPTSRRKIWNLIKSIQHDKVIILTTHLMEEAENLSHRIVILTDGKMACIGDSLELKQKFGKGYSINIIAKSSNDIPNIKSFISSLLPNSSLYNESADYLNFCIPVDTDSQQLIKFFKALEELSKDQDSNPIRDYGISNATLDDVFIEVTSRMKQD